jgi:hypothetical protein
MLGWGGSLKIEKGSVEAFKSVIDWIERTNAMLRLFHQFNQDTRDFIDDIRHGE